MKKKILAVAGILLLILLIAPTFMSPKFSMSRSIEIDAPVSTVYSKLTDLNEYVKWNPFPEGDPTNQAEVSGIGVWSTLVWKGDKTGEGKMTIIEMDQDKDVVVKMDFYKPMSGEGVVHWLTKAKSDSRTEMIWTFDQRLSYFNRYFGLFMDKMMGKHFEKGLSNYKALVEASK